MADFVFKQFVIRQTGVGHRVGTDAVLLGAWAEPGDARSILDIGSGTGVIALMMAQKTAMANITAVEIFSNSARCARENFNDSRWAARLELIESSVQDFAAQAPAGSVDFIVSNPPYFSEKTQSPDLGRRLGRSVQSLDYKDLISVTQHLLAPGGKSCFVLPYSAAQSFMELGAIQGLYASKYVAVSSVEGKKPARCLLQLERDPSRFIRDALSIETAAGQYSEAFKELTRDFYLKF
jgi:tRNA1Val (adenine37-N6)-methyltransferase